MTSGRMLPGATVISGGSRGLGLALVERFLDRGDRVATFSRSGSAALDALLAAHPDRLHAAQIDAADAAAVRRFVEVAADRFDGVEHCIANAAVAHDGVLAMIRDDEIDAMLGVNLRGSIVLVRECVRRMLIGSGPGRPELGRPELGRPERGRPERGRPELGGPELGGPELGWHGRDMRRDVQMEGRQTSVVVISSVVAGRGSPGLAVYAATKAGLEGFAKSLARELGPRGIRVNAVAPGFLETDLSASLSDRGRERIAGRTPLGRLGLPADVVGAVDFLTGPRAAFITGQVIAVDGGAAG